MMPVKADLANCIPLSIMCLDIAKVWLSCSGIN